MAFIYYLPEIIFLTCAAAAVIAVVRALPSIFGILKGKEQCPKCRAATVREDVPARLFLLPVSFGDTYENAEDYLLSHMVPIQSKEAIPTGRRACRMELYRCPKCDARWVKITDFLQVRDTEDIKGFYTFPYEHFSGL